MADCPNPGPVKHTSTDQENVETAMFSRSVRILVTNSCDFAKPFHANCLKGARPAPIWAAPFPSSYSDIGEPPFSGAKQGKELF